MSNIQLLSRMFLFILLSFSEIFSQVNYDCAFNLSSVTGYPVKPSKTPVFGENLRCLIIYVTFPDDNFPSAGDGFWQPHTQPTSPNGTTGLLATSEGNPLIPFMNRYPDYTISDWFSEMSMGQLDVIGDEVHVEMPNDSYWYKNNNYHQATMNMAAIELANQEYPGLNFADYDRWEFNSSTHEWVQNPDGIVDMIIVCYRFIPSDNDSHRWFFCGNAASGEGSLGGLACGTWSDLSIDNKLIKGGFGPESGSGCIAIGQRLRYSGVAQIIQHELSHSFLVNELHNNNHSSLGIMVGSNSSCFIFSPFERSRSILGWNINPTVVTTTGNYTLGDYVSTGGMLKIQIPGTSGEYFWVANHQKASLYDGISRGGKICYATNTGEQNPYCGEGKGLFIYHESAGCLNNFNKSFDLEQAEGKWNWTITRYIPYWNPPPVFNIPLFDQVTPNGGMV